MHAGFLRYCEYSNTKYSGSTRKKYTSNITECFGASQPLVLQAGKRHYHHHHHHRRDTNCAMGPASGILHQYNYYLVADGTPSGLSGSLWRTLPAPCDQPARLLHYPVNFRHSSKYQQVPQCITPSVGPGYKGNVIFVEPGHSLGLEKSITPREAVREYYFYRCCRVHLERNGELVARTRRSLDVPVLHHSAARALNYYSNNKERESPQPTILVAPSSQFL